MCNHSGPRNNWNAAPCPAQRKGTKEAETEKGDKYNKVGRREQCKGCKTRWMYQTPPNCCISKWLKWSILCYAYFITIWKKKGSRYHSFWEVFLNDENSQTHLKLGPLPSERSYTTTLSSVFMDHRNKSTYWEGSTNRPSDPSGWLLQRQHDTMWGRLLRNL